MDPAVSDQRVIAYLFPGQGSQYIGMGKDLYEQFPEARQIMDQATKALDFNLLDACFKEDTGMLAKTRYCQPAIFVVSMAAYEVLKKHPKSPKVQPKFMAGLSLGEATALCASGAISFEEGVRFVRDRGLFMDEASEARPGMMAAVLGMELDKVEQICTEAGAEIGNLNAPGQVVISGYKENVESAMEKLKAAGARRVIPLDVSGGFHSSCMNSACSKIEKALQGVALRSPSVPVVTNLTGRVESLPDEIRRNLIHQMNHRTLWEESMRFMVQNGVNTFYEIGPGTVLRGLLRKIAPEAEVVSLGTAEDFNGYQG